MIVLDHLKQQAKNMFTLRKFCANLAPHVLKEVQTAKQIVKDSENSIRNELKLIDRGLRDEFNFQAQ